MCNNIVKRAGLALLLNAHLVVTTSVLGATATFTPIGPTAVDPGTDVVFEVTVSVDTLAEFNTADILIGSNAATDIAFAYSDEWTAAFASVTSPFFDTGPYAQDVFVGGNDESPVGASLFLGTVTVSTTGMGGGAFSVVIDNGFDGVSTLGLGGQPEALNGNGAFTISAPTPAVPSATEWGLAIMMVSLLTVGTLVVRARRSHAHAPRTIRC